MSGGIFRPAADASTRTPGTDAARGQNGVPAPSISPPTTGAARVPRASAGGRSIGLVPASSIDRWITLVLLGVGAFFAVVGATILISAVRRRRRWRTHPGRVVASRLNDGQFRFQVAFDYDGREVRFWNRYTTSLGADPVGRDVEVLVNPADPSQAVVSKGQSRPEAAGVAFLVFGVVAELRGYAADHQRRRPPTPPTTNAADRLVYLLSAQAARPSAHAADRLMRLCTQATAVEGQAAR